jgi:predicted Zn-dependent protease
MPYKKVSSSLDYHLVRAKLRASSGLAQTVIDQFQRNIKQGRFANEIATHYGLAVAMLRTNDVVGASNQMQWLKENAPKNAFIENLSAKIEVIRNNPQAAAKKYIAGLKSFPSNRALIYGYAEHFLAIKQTDKMIKLVQNKMRAYPNDAYFYQLLAKAYTAKGKSLLRHQAQAEAYYRQYNYQRAVEQMTFATRAKDGSFYEKSIVEARLKDLQRQLENREPS